MLFLGCRSSERGHRSSECRCGLQILLVNNQEVSANSISPFTWRLHLQPLRLHHLAHVLIIHEPCLTLALNPNIAPLRCVSSDYTVPSLALDNNLPLSQTPLITARLTLICCIQLSPQSDRVAIGLGLG